ncbi:hypothetical protein LYNGBM3L_22950 [Moorena producens 3L]|uniref:Uncharacterized protein n=1 Tax=Moorena producens 3L TaxID=489825 RepID=F4XMW2_9CYAN|nr:hypothetical protein LYNGBM3L_22950 [Moorena producens 3L]
MYLIFLDYTIFFIKLSTSKIVSIQLSALSYQLSSLCATDGAT